MEFFRVSPLDLGIIPEFILGTKGNLPKKFHDSMMNIESEAFFMATNQQVIQDIKRVIGLPGETVTIKDGKVYINDSEEPLDDSFCPETPLSDGDGVYQVPEDSYFMMGDNRNLSRDSRFWINKYVSRDKILGKAVLRYWPLNKIKLLN